MNNPDDNHLVYEKNVIKQAFNDKNTFLSCIERIPDEKMFVDPLCKLLWQIFIIIYKENTEVSVSSVSDVLEYTKNDANIAPFNALINDTYIDESEWKYHLSYLLEQYRKKELIAISDNIRGGIGAMSSNEILEDVSIKMTELNSTEIQTVSFKEAYRSSMTNIKNIASGVTKSILRTDHQKFDQIVSLSGKKIVVVAAQKKIGKTRFVVDLVDLLVQYNEKDIAIQWDSFEMQSDEMIRLFLSKKVRLTDKQLLSINYTLTPDEIKKIEETYGRLNHYPIEFVDETANIFSICAKFERFAAANKGKIPVLIIDNIGLIKPHLGNDTQFEDDVARHLKDLRDKTGGLIIVVHHLSKESESKFNIAELYQPKLTHIRGSSRIVDFANIVLLLHRNEHYPDVVKKFTKEGKFHLIDKLLICDCAANRNGSTGIIDFRHELKFSTFKEI